MSTQTKTRWQWPHHWPQFREPTYWHHVVAFVAVAVAIILVFLCLNYFYAGAVQTLSQVSATSERVAFQVTQPRLAAFHVRAMRIGPSSSGTSRDPLDGKCVEGVVTPVLGTSITYGRVGYGPLSIKLQPPLDTVQESPVTGTFASVHADNELSLIGGKYLESDDKCDRDLVSTSGVARIDTRQKLPEPLPIWGKATIGAEFAGAAGSMTEPRFLLDGKLTLSAQSVTLFSIMRPTLYPVTELDLPVASRLEAFSTAPQAEHSKSSDYNRTQEVNWWGIAYVHDEKPALTIVVATDVPKLALYRPNRHDPDVIEATMLTQVLNDPNLIRVYKLLAVIVASGAVFGGWLVRAFKKPEKASRHGKAHPSKP